ncbi:DUF2461 domain-containing protein [Yonghaparkia sp. Soil809]|uniref:DUF2461 domain-containing protein n=1 Tax=Yonghaparkia sp. Soil809 TaxID=1736417 RepID=UPI0006FBAC69|nr:DUF2461 domain-containing protein [Yonghaparkia sp. Soil809]KRF32775.1 hypothetical protein ASG83_01665 [Yonghaparkia sp. Soil809]
MTESTGPAPATGLDPDVFAFYAELEQNQNREWWLANKQRYDERVKAPVERLVDALGGEFGPLKIFRPYKDVRFSADKRPYKDHLGLVSADSSAGTYYLQVSHHGLMLAGGEYQPSREQLARFREICDDNRLVGDLEATLDEAAERGFAIMTADALATAPRGYRADHPKIALLRLKRLAVAAEHAPAEWMTGPELVDRVRAGWRVVGEWNTWLAENLPAPVEAAR